MTKLHNVLSPKPKRGLLVGRWHGKQDNHPSDQKHAPQNDRVLGLQGHEDPSNPIKPRKTSKQKKGDSAKKKGKKRENLKLVAKAGPGERRWKKKAPG